MKSENKIKHPFTVPQGYFDNLDEQILSEIKLRNIAKKEQIFNVDQSYFDNLEDKILAKTVNKRKGLSINFQLVYRVAAAILVFFSLGYFGYQNYIEKPPMDMSDVKSDEIIAFLESDPVAYNYVNNNIDDIGVMGNGTNIKEMNLSNVSEEDIEDFLPPPSLDK